jgi:hypothetical protein
MAKGKEVAVQQGGDMATMFGNQVPDWAKNGEGRGNENVGSKDIVLPRLEIVQAQSPIKDTDEAARDGLMFNTVSMEVLGDTVYIVPVYYRMEYILWKDQDSGGGFFGAYNSENEAKQRMEEEIDADPSLQGVSKDGKPILEIVDTPVHYCLRVKPDMSVEQIVVSMPKSKAKVSRKWNAAIQMVGGDRFARAYKLTTFKDKNKQNKTFFNYVVQPAGYPPEQVFREAERLYGIFKEQGVRADHASGAAAVGNPEGGDTGDGEI